MSDKQLAEIQERVLYATPGPLELYPEYGPNFYANVQGEMLLPVGSVEFGEGETAEADRALFVHAAEDLSLLLAEIDRLQRERHTTNEALSDAAQALRAANTAAGLVAEYRVPTPNGRWLSVRREPNGDRWCVMAWTLHSGTDRRSMAWVGGRWQVLPAYGENGVWEFDTADAALAEATRLAEAGDRS